jgi:hypothetical protein
LKEKISKLTVVLDKSQGGKAIGEVEFDMADYDLGRYKYRTLYLKKVDENDFLDFDPASTYL